MSGRHLRTDRIGGGRRAVLTLVDQIVSSASNFLLGVLIAHASGASGLGTFGIAFLVWLAVVGTNRAMVTEPMTVTGSTDPRDAQLPEGLVATLTLGLAVGILLGTLGTALQLAGIKGTALMALSVWIPSLLTQDYCRSMAFRMQRPDYALASDGTFAVVQVVLSLALFLVGSESTAAFVAAWGLGATAGTLIGVVLLRIQPTWRGGLRQLRKLWPRSRGFLAEFGMAFPADQGYLLLLPILLGTFEFGFYRSGMGLVGPVVVILVAGGNIGLPECVRRLREGGMTRLAGYARGLTVGVVGLTVLYCATVAVFAEPMLRLVYGTPFVEAVTITRLIAVQYVLMALSFGFGQAVKATGRMRLLWVSRAVSAVLSISAMVGLAGNFGLMGAGLASILAGSAYSIGVLIAYRKLRHDGKGGLETGVAGEPAARHQGTRAGA